MIFIVFAGIISLALYCWFSYKPPLRIKLSNMIENSTKAPMLHRILKERYHIEYVQHNYDMVFEQVYGNEVEPRHDVIKVIMTPEAYLPTIENYDLVIGFNHIDHPSYIRIPFYYYGGYFPKLLKAGYNRKEKQGDCTPQKPYFACFLVSNGSSNNIRTNTPLDGVSARDHLFTSLLSYKFVASGGKHLNNIGHIVLPSETNTWLSQCKNLSSHFS